MKGGGNKERKKKRRAPKEEKITYAESLPYISKHKQEMREKYFYDDEDEVDEYENDFSNLKHKLHAINYNYYTLALKQLIDEQNKPLVPLKLGPLLPKTIQGEEARNFNGQSMYNPQFGPGSQYNKLVSPTYEMFHQSQLHPHIVGSHSAPNFLPPIQQDRGSMEGGDVQQDEPEYQIINGRRYKVKRTVVNGPVRAEYGADEFMKNRDQSMGNKKRRPKQQDMDDDDGYDLVESQYISPQQVRAQQGRSRRANEEEVALNDTDPSRVPRRGKNLLRKSSGGRSNKRGQEDFDDYDDYDQQQQHTNTHSRNRSMARSNVGGGGDDSGGSSRDSRHQRKKKKEQVIRRANINEEMDDYYDGDDGEQNVRSKAHRRKDEERSNGSSRRNISVHMRNQQRDEIQGDFDDEDDDGGGGRSAAFIQRSRGRQGANRKMQTRIYRGGTNDDEEEGLGDLDEFKPKKSRRQITEESEGDNTNDSPTKSMKNIAAKRKMMQRHLDMDDIENEQHIAEVEGKLATEQNIQRKKTMMMKKKTVVAPSQYNIKSSKNLRD